ncbi:hypothetical protein BH20ACT17_BH20ACT17_15130 [soil metagenome]
MQGYRYLPGKQTDEQGRISTIAYDSTDGNKGNPKTISQNGQSITLNYVTGAPGKLASIVNERGKTTSYGYDAAGNLSTITPPLPLGQTVFTYAASISRVASVNDGKGQTRTLGYDNLDRVTSIDYAGGSTLSFVYDRDGNLTAQNDSISGRNSSFTYDQLSRPTFASLAGQSSSYGYDAASNLTSIVRGSKTTTYAYDQANNNTSAKEPGVSTAIALGVDDNNRRTTTTYPNGVVVQRGYEQPAGRLDFIKATKGSTVLQHESYVYAYDAEGSFSAGQGVMRIRTVDHKNNRSTRYQYDARNRLVRARTYTTGGTVPSASDGCYVVGALACYEYAYDAASNRTTRITTGYLIANTTTNFTYNDANQLLSKSGQPAGTPDYTYDANGNQLTRPTSPSALRAMAYNERDQASPIDGVSLAYLGAGQDQPISEGSLSLRYDLLGLDERVNASSTDDYTREINGTPLSQRTTTTSGSSSEYYLSDALGSITATTDSAGNLQAT